MLHGTTSMPRGTTRSHNPVYFQGQVQRRATISITELKDGRSPNTYSSRVTTPACGYNGSSGGSIRTYAGSDTCNIACNGPFRSFKISHSMLVIHEGRSGCGETPDSGENLQVKYKTASGSWTTFHTFQGGGAQTSNFHYSAVLPVAALHSSSQFRFQQTSGSGTCCDYWFFDDVKVVIPPTSTWTSPTFGYNSSNRLLTC